MGVNNLMRKLLNTLQLSESICRLNTAQTLNIRSPRNPNHRLVQKSGFHTARPLLRKTKSTGKYQVPRDYVRLHLHKVHLISK